MTTPNINQFAISTVAGESDLQFVGSVVTARVSVNQATALVAGQPVQIENSGAQGLPSVLALSANTANSWGICLRNLKDASFITGATVEIGRENTVVYLPASAAIARGASVEIDATTFNVKTWAGVNPIIGEAYDQAVNVGDLIRVWLHLPNSSAISRGVKTADVVATLAQINAGLLLIPGITGASVRVLNYTARVTGAFATGTSVELESDTTTVAVTTLAEAGLSNGAVLIPASGNTTLGAGFATLLPAGEGLKVVNNGAAQTGGTSIEFVITYQQF
jgi:hypothetical protein